MPIRTLTIKVVPRSRVPSLTEQPDGSWIARVKAPPVDGKANEEVIRLVAEHFDCPKNRVSVRLGATARRKVIQIEEM